MALLFLGKHHPGTLNLLSNTSIFISIVIVGLCVVANPLLLFALITDFDSRAILLNNRRWDVYHPFPCLPTSQ